MTGGREPSSTTCHSHRRPIAPPAPPAGLRAQRGRGSAWRRPLFALIPATLAFGAIAAAIALANFAAFLFIEAGAPQSPTIGQSLAAFGAIAAAGALAPLPPLLLVDAGAGAALAIGRPATMVCPS